MDSEIKTEEEVLEKQKEELESKNRELDSEVTKLKEEIFSLMEAKTKTEKDHAQHIEKLESQINTLKSKHETAMREQKKVFEESQAESRTVIASLEDRVSILNLDVEAANTTSLLKSMIHLISTVNSEALGNILLT